jgi:hypothetical protein
MYLAKQLNQRITDDGNDSRNDDTNEDLRKIPGKETNNADDQDDEKKFVFLVQSSHASGLFCCSVEVFQEMIFGFQGRSYKD